MPIYPREIIREVAAANDIVDVIGEYVQLQRSGSSFKGLSPFTNEKTPSFYVSPDKQAWYCFSSQQGGDVFRFLIQQEGVGFNEALERLAQRANITLTAALTPEMEAAERDRKAAMSALRQVADFYHRMLCKSPQAEPARAYLKQRGIGIETARNWKLGYAPRSHVTMDWIRQSQLSQKACLDAKILDQSDRDGSVYPFFRERLMFPINNRYGEPIAFSGRVVHPDQKGGKYVNSRESNLFYKSKVFFGFDKASPEIRKEKTAIVCEGQLDVITAHENGVKNIVAPLGTALTEDHAKMLRRQVDDVVICFDADRAGQEAASKSFNELAKQGANVRIARMPEGEDPDSMIHKHGAEAFRKVIAEAEEYFDYQIHSHLPNTDEVSIREKVQLAHRLAKRAALIDDRMQRDLLIDRLATRLGVAAEDLRRTATNEWFEREKQAEKTAPAPVEQPRLIPDNHVIITLCRLLLNSVKIRDWIRSQTSLESFRDIPGTEILGYLWDAEFDPADPAEVHSFLATLPSEAQSAISFLQLKEGPEGEEALAEACLKSLHRQSIENRIRERIARMRDGSLEFEEIAKLQKEVLDLKKRLKNIAEPQAPERPA